MGAATAKESGGKTLRFHQSAALLRQLTEHAAVATFLVGTNGQLFYANRAFCDLLGYEPDEAIGLGISQILHPDDTGAAHERVAKLSSGAINDYRAECRYLRKNGEAIWVVACATALQHQRSGRRLYLIVQAVNIDAQKRAEAALAESESRWNFALEGAGQGVWDHDLRSKRAFYSPTWKQMRGIDPEEEVDPAKEVWLARVHPEDRDRIRDIVRRQDSGEIPHNAFEYRERHRDGHWMWILSRGKPVEWFSDGSVARIIGTDTDITDLKTVEAELAAEKERLRVTLESIGDGVVSTDAGGRVTFMNPAAEEMTGWRAAEAVGRPVGEVVTIVEASTGAATADPVAECVKRGTLFHLDGDPMLVSRTGERRDIRDSATPLKMPHGDTAGAVLVFRDVTSSRTLRRELAHSAMHDSLTGLPNRAAFTRTLEQTIAGARVERRTHALCFLDLDGFKQVNDSAGHVAGDRLLQDVAHAIRRNCRSNDFAARLGGDEFAMILSDCSLADTRKVTQQIVDSIAALQFLWREQPYTVTASVGIAAVTDRSPHPAALLNEADAACYVAKASGGNRVAIHSDEDGQLLERSA
jgi:diguanylate cyclase (GGDEF)-like protein/PAS domain S-box-containing protein